MAIQRRKGNRCQQCGTDGLEKRRWSSLIVRAIYKNSWRSSWERIENNEKLKNEPFLLTEALELALERSQIPDKYGCWRPRSTIRYIMTGNRPTAPTAPLPIPGGATGSFSYISFSMSSKKRYLMNSLINLQSRLATLNDLITARNYCATAILFHATCRH